jgi:hypothetical protein
MAQGEGPEFKPQCCQKKKKKKMAGEVHLCLEPSVSQGRILEGGWQRKVSLTHNMDCF